jgi:hypothetical protein
VTLQCLFNASLSLGILESEMHDLGATCMREIESDFRYSKISFNNFPWPENPSEEKMKAVEIAPSVLDVRAKSTSSLASLTAHNASRLKAASLRAVDSATKKILLRQNGWVFVWIMRMR